MEDKVISNSLPRWMVTSILLALVLVGFALRLNFLLGRLFFVDEYFSMLAALMTLEKGAPILPTGVFYDHGLIVSYLAAFSMFIMGGFSEIAVRFPVLVISVITIPVSYGIGRKLFKSQAAGLIAALLFVFERTSILWGGRIRMYAPAYLAVILMSYFLFEGTIRKPAAKYRILFILSTVLALWSHYVTAFVVPPMILLVSGILLFNPAVNTSWLRKKTVLPEILVAVVAMGLVVATLFSGQFRNNLDTSSAAYGAKGLAYYLNLNLNPGSVKTFIPYFQREINKPLVFFSAIALIFAVVNLVRKKSDFVDLAALFVTLLIPLIVLEFSLFANAAWLDRRYLYILSLPFMILAASCGIVYLGKTLKAALLKLSGGNRNLSQSATIGALILVALSMWFLWGDKVLHVLNPGSTGGYATAFTFINKNWEDGDQTITWHTAACFIYLPHCDYYANDTTAKLVFQNGQWVDKYIGSSYIEDIDAFNKVLATGRRTWFVVDLERFFSRYTNTMRQQIINQMYLLRNDDGVLVFQSQPEFRPVAKTPANELSADFGVLTLEGYRLSKNPVSPDDSVYLTTFWKPTAPFNGQRIKSFVHLRNQNNETVVQADHELAGIHDNLLVFKKEWNKMKADSGWLRDSSALSVPNTLPPGVYTLYLGLYNPETLERYPLKNDASGENAVILEKIVVPQSDFDYEP